MKSPLPLLATAVFLLLTSGLSLGDAPQPKTIPLRIEADALLALTHGPHTSHALTRDRYFRLYHFPGMYRGGVAAHLRFLRVSPGRGTGPFFGDDGGDSLRFGKTDSEDGTIEAFAKMASAGALEHPGATYAAAGGSFPEFQKPGSASTGEGAVEPTMKVKHNRAIQPEDQGHVAELIHRWLERLSVTGAPSPGFYSPVNEPDASWKSGPTSSLDHANFVRALALQLRETQPDVRVSGPCTAWPYPGEDWKRWGAAGWERALIETAGDVLGAYDFHLYTKELWAYGPESPGFKPERKMPIANLFASESLGHPEIMEFGKADVLLDLVAALHLARWGRPVPPVIISEFGRQGITPQLGPWANDYLYFLYSATVTRMWMRLMDRPEIELTVPFILPESDPGYGPQRGQALATRPGAPDNITTQKTPLAGWLEMFRSIEGERVPVKWGTTDPALARGLFAVACRNASGLQILIHNATPDAIDVPLQLGDSQPWPSGVRVARTRWEGAVPVDHRVPTPENSTWRRDHEALEVLASPRLELQGEETALVTIPWVESPKRQIITARHYAPQFLQGLSDRSVAEFTFSLDDEDLNEAKNARLVLGYSAPVGPAKGTGALRVLWDGASSPATVFPGLTEGWRQIAVPVEVEVPVEQVHSGTWKIRVDGENETLPPGSRIVSARLDIQKELAITSQSP